MVSFESEHPATRVGRTATKRLSEAEAQLVRHAAGGRAPARAAPSQKAQFRSKPASTAPTKRQEKLLRTIDALLDARTPRADDLRLALATIEEHRRRPLQDLSLIHI